MKTATGKVIAEIRRKQKLTQGALAKKLNTTSQFVSLLENGHSKLPHTMIVTVSGNKKDFKAAIVRALCKDYETEIRQNL